MYEAMLESYSYYGKRERENQECIMAGEFSTGPSAEPHEDMTTYTHTHTHTAGPAVRYSTVCMQVGACVF